MRIDIYKNGVLVSSSGDNEPTDQTITGNQWAFALGDMGLSAAWRAAVAKSKDKDQIRCGLISRDTSLYVNDPLLLRVAANAGTDSSGNSIINVSSVFLKAFTEPT